MLASGPVASRPVEDTNIGSCLLVHVLVSAFDPQKLHCEKSLHVGLVRNTMLLLSCQNDQLAWLDVARYGLGSCKRDSKGCCIRQANVSSDVHQGQGLLLCRACWTFAASSLDGPGARHGTSAPLTASCCAHACQTLSFWKDYIFKL